MFVSKIYFTKTVLFYKTILKIKKVIEVGDNDAIQQTIQNYHEGKSNHRGVDKTEKY